MFGFEGKSLRRRGLWIALALLACILGGLAALAWSRSELVAPEPTFLLRDRDGRFLDDVAADDEEGFGYWRLETLPARVVAATLTIEDRRFWQHPGVDVVAVARAFRDNFASGSRISGASTIAMQVARLQNPGPRTYLRKAFEAVEALLMTARYGREAVLAHYLRIVPYGNRFFGIGHAARRYFDKPVEDLSWAETAFLCAIPQAPAHMNPYTGEGRHRAVRRARRILQALYEKGGLFPGELEQALSELANLTIPAKAQRPPEAMHAILRLNEELRDARSAGFGLNEELRDARPAGFGLNEELRGARSAGFGLNEELREARPAVGGRSGASEFVPRGDCGEMDGQPFLPPPRSGGGRSRSDWEGGSAEFPRTLLDAPASNAYLVESTIDLDIQKEVANQVWEALKKWRKRGVGNVAAMVLDRKTFEVLASVGSADYFDEEDKGSIDYTRVPRFPGSALKPFYYALALERGTLTPATVMADLARGDELARNADSSFLGPLLPRQALANSRNIPAIRLVSDLGVERSYQLLADLKLHDFARPASFYGRGIAIGGIPVRLQDLLRAYTTLAGDGELVEPLWYRGQRRAPPRKIFEASTARLISLFLSDPVARLPGFPRMGWSEYPFPVAVKTGTSSAYRDAWTLAWSSRYLIGVWFGDPDYRPTQRVSGYRAGAALARAILSYLHKDELDGLEDLSFPPPRGYRSVKLCALTGHPTSEWCDRVVEEWLPADQATLEPCTAHRRLAVDIRNGLLATAETPREYVRAQTFVDLPPEYAAWASAQGLARAPTRVSVLGAGAKGEHVKEAYANRAYSHEEHASQQVAHEKHASQQVAHEKHVDQKHAEGGKSAEALKGNSMASAVAGASRLAAMPGGPSRLDKIVRLRITSPRSDVLVMRDPESPEEQNTVALSVLVEPPVEQVLWYVDKKPFRVVDYPYEVRWPLEVGEHEFQAQVPYTHFESVSVRARFE